MKKMYLFLILFLFLGTGYIGVANSDIGGVLNQNASANVFDETNLTKLDAVKSGLIDRNAVKPYQTASPLKAGSSKTIYGYVIYDDAWLDFENEEIVEDYGYYSFTTDNPSGSSKIFNASENICAGAFANGTYYVNSYASVSGSVTVSELGKLNLTTGAYTLIKDYKNETNKWKFSDMTYDYSTSTLYGIVPTGANSSRVVTINTTTGVVTPLATDTDAYLITLACNYSGTMYAVTNGGDFCSINKTTGAKTVVGATGKAPNYVQSMDFDHTDGKLYWAFCDNSSGLLCTIDTSNGVATSLGTLGGNAEVVGMYVPFTAPLPPVESVPYESNFTAAQWPSWKIIDANNDGKTWTRIATGGAQYNYSSANVGNDWLISPPIALSQGSYKLSFEYASKLATYPEKMKVFFGKGATAEAQTTLLADYDPIASTTFKKASLMIDVTEAGDYNFSFYAYSDKNQYNLLVQNVKLTLLLDNDLAATTVTGDAINPVNIECVYKVTVINEGKKPQSNYKVHLVDESGTILATTNVVDAALESGTSTVIEVKYTPTITNSALKIYGKVELTGDENTSNDKTPKEITVNIVNSYTVSGKVIDVTGANVSNANVAIIGSKNYEGITTAADGTFSINNVLALSSDYTLLIYKDGFEDYTKKFKVETGNVDLGAISLADDLLKVLNIKAVNNTSNVSLTWNDNTEQVVFKYDNGSLMGGVGAAAADVICGAIHNKPAVLSNISWVSTSTAVKKVNVFIYDLNEDGTPSKTVLFRADNISQTNLVWNSYNLPQDIDCPRGFVIGISAPTATNVALGYDDTILENPGKNLVMLGAAANWVPLETLGDFKGNFLIRAKGIELTSENKSFADVDIIKKSLNLNLSKRDAITLEEERIDNTIILNDYKDINASKALVGYDVYRLLMNDIETPANWVKLTTSPVTAKSFIDNTWGTINMGAFLYAVEAVYTNNRVSDANFSNMVTKNMGTEITINVTSNITSGDATGANVLVTNNDGDSEHVYSGIVADGKVVLTNVWKGTYKINITLAGYTSIEELNVDFTTENSYSKSYTLNEIVVVPFNLEIVETEIATERIFNWNVPEQLNITEGFESHENFVINSAGEIGWSYIDGDGANTYSIEGRTFPNQGLKMSYIVFNPSGVTPALTTGWNANSGNKYLVSFAAVTPPNDDWFISPELAFKSSFTFKFWAKSATDQYGLERFKVMYSTTGKEKADFTNVVSPGEFVEAPIAWTEFVYSIPANAKYVTIQCISPDYFAFLLDDVFIGIPENSSKVLQKYEVYLDGTKKADTNQPTYRFTELTNGNHTAGVKAIYGSTTTEMITVDFSVATIVPYITPNTGVTYTFDDLVEKSNGTVIKSGGEYLVRDDLTISATDELKVATNITVKIAKDKILTIAGGKFVVDAPTRAIFTAASEENNYGTISIDENSYVRLNKATFTYGKGMRVLDSDFIMDNCTMNYHASSSQASGAIATTRGKIIVKNSTFKHNVRSAFASGANMGCTFEIENCYLENNVTENSNRPQINVGPARDGETTKIIGCTIIGNRENVKVGGISTSSLLAVPTKSLIEGNTIKDNRYGITFTGSKITGIIKNNILTDNNTENNPAIGGSGINITAAAGETHAVITGNTITGHLWGITLVGNTSTYATGPTANIGNITVDTDDPNYNIGKNIFSNNGNGGVLCDLYNNTPNDIMAQNNTWGVEVQDETSIATVIVDKTDDSRYGTVTYMPAYDPSDSPFKPRNVVAAVNNTNVDITWEEGSNVETKYLQYCNDDIDNGVGTNGANTFSAAITFPADVMAEYVGGRITEITVGISDNAPGLSASSVWLRNTLTGANLLSQSVTLTPNSWNTITLNEPYTIGSGTLAIGYTCTVTGGYPLGTTSNTQNAANGGNLAVGTTWTTLAAVPLPGNLAIIGTVMIGGKSSTISLTDDRPFVPTITKFTEANNAKISGLDSANTKSIKFEKEIATGSKALLGYKVWRFLEANQGNESEWTALTPEVVTETSFTDNTWSSAGQGIYKYAVRAISSGNIASEAAFSNRLEKDMTTVVTVNVKIAGTSTAVVEADVKLTNNDAIPAHIYTGKTDATGKIVLSNVYKGIYKVDIMASGYSTLTETNVDFSTNATYNVEYSVGEQIEEPFNLEIIETGIATQRVFNWNVPKFIEDSFENHTSFAVNSPGELGWSYIDGDNSTTYSIQDVTFPNQASKMAYIVFEPSAATPALTNWTSHTGNKYLVSFAATTPANNDWIISPELAFGKAVSFEFWAKSATEQYGLERFKVLYSTTGNNKADFTNVLTTGSYATAPIDWTKFTYNLPANAKYVTIQCVSNDAFAFLVDDIFIGIHESKALTNYEVYLDGTKVATTNTKTHTFNDLPVGNHTAGVKAVYTTGSSSLQTIAFNVEGGANKFYVTYAQSANGTLTVKNGNQDVPSGSMVEEGTTLTVTATPNTGYSVDTFTANGTAITNNSVTITGETTIVATFAKSKYVVTIEQQNGGTISVRSGVKTINSGDEVEHGAVLTISAKANEGFEAKSILVNNEELSGNKYTVVSTTTISAIFAPVGVNDLESLSLRIYPNPVKDIMNIEGEYSLMEIYNVTGKLMLTANGETSIDVSTLTSGTYIIKVRHEHKVATYKIVK